MNTLISAKTLQQLVEQQQVVVFDCRFSLAAISAGARAYAQGHIPGGHYADLNQDLSTPHIPGKTGRHPLPNRHQWIVQVLDWGLSADQQVVVYDDAGGAIAARMWWMLQWIGHDKVAVLDGGLAAWQQAGYPLTDVVPKTASTADNSFSNLEPLVTQVMGSAVNADMQVLLDARDPARFRGEVEPIDPVAAHIPGARNYPYANNLNPDGTFRSKAELAKLFEYAGNSFLPVISYCGSGVTACHNILAMKHAGLTVPVLYAGSWSEWVADGKRSVATGP